MILLRRGDLMSALYTLVQAEYLKNETFAKIIHEANLDAALKGSSTLSPSAGCTLYKVKDEKGKAQPTYIYTASYLKYDETAGKTSAKKAVMAILWLVMVALHIGTIYTSTALDFFIWVRLIDSFAFLAVLYFTYTMLVQITSPENKTIYKYAVGSNRMKTTALGLFAIYLLCFIIILCCAVFGSHLTSDVLTPMVMQLGAAIAAGAIFLIEQKRKVIAVENDYKIPEGAILVDQVYNA